MNESFSDTLRSLRRQQNLSASQLAERAGVARESLMEWECGDSMPSPDEFVRLLGALGVSAERLMGDYQPPVPAVPGVPGVLGAPAAPAATQLGLDELAQQITGVLAERYGGRLDSNDISDAVRDALGDALEDIEDAVEDYLDEADEDEEDEDDEEDEEDDDEDVDDAAPTESGESPTWKHIRELAPFLGKKALDQLAHRALEGEKPNYHAIQSLAPFLSREKLDSLVSAAGEQGVDWHMVSRLAPFLSRETLSRLAGQALSGAQPDWGAVKRLAPFLPSEFLDKLALGLFNMDGRCGK